MKRAFAILLLLVACGREQRSAAAPAAPPEPATPKTEVGDVMPAYNATLIDGQPLKLSAEKGSVVLLNVWATWCGPCRFEIPELQTLYKKYEMQGFKVVGVSVDETGVDAVKQFVNENKMTYPVAVDAEGRIANVLSTTVLPTSIIIGRDGKILWRKVGAVMPNEVSSLDAVIQQALSKKS